MAFLSKKASNLINKNQIKQLCSNHGDASVQNYIGRFELSNYLKSNVKL